MESIEIITLYEHIAVLTDQMLNAARNRDWEQLTELENDCSSKVQKIRDNESPAYSSGTQRAKNSCHQKNTG
jgi:flagellar protein FliT